MNIQHKGFFISLLFGIVLTTTGFSCTLLQPKEATQEASRPIALTLWGVFDEEGSFDSLIGAYRTQHPNVSVTYRKFRLEEYENEILQALAEDRGPDIISLPNTWVDRYSNKLLPMPPVMRIGFQVTKGGIKKVKESEIRQIPGYTSSDVRTAFLDTVSEDVIRPTEKGEAILALPFSVDTLALFYNKTLLRNTGVIIGPPKYWAISDDDPEGAQKKALFQDFVSQVQSNRLTIIDPNTTQITQSGAAFGAAKNIQRSSDILATLMMQNGAQMNAQGTVNFDYDSAEPRPLPINPGVDALRFYTDFASPVKQVYTWSEDMPDSLEAFAQGRTAMFFGYSYHAQSLRQRAPQLKVGIVPIPQINPLRPVVAANYWVYGVSKKSPNSDYAWDFLRFSTQPENLKNYLTANKRPTALKALIEEQKTDPDLEPFASQLLFARTWYHGKSPASMEQAFQDMITDALAAKGASVDEERARLTAAMEKARQVIQNGW